MGGSGKKVITIAFVAILLGMYAGYVHFDDCPHPSITFSVGSYDAYGECVADITRDEFLAAGFSAGDDVTISTDSGFKAEAVVCYNWTCLFLDEFFISYNDRGQNVVFGLECVSRYFSLGDVITVEKTGTDPRYDVLENYRGGVISEQGGMSDSQYANFREVTCGDIVCGTLFRGYSMFRDDARSETGDRLCGENGIKTFIDLSDSSYSLEKKLSGGVFDDRYAYGIYRDGGMFAVNPGVFLFDQDHISGMSLVLHYIADNEGPYMVFCDIGKDRTGMVMMLLEGLMGATADEVIDDYMQSFTSLYGIAGGAEYDIIEKKMACRLVVMLFDTGFAIGGYDYDIDSVDIGGLDLHGGAVEFMKEWCGIDDDTIGKIMENLS